MRASSVYIFTTDYLGELEIRILIVQHQIIVLMVFVLVVVLEIVVGMMFLVPSFDHHTLIPLSICLEEFLDPWCNTFFQKYMKKPLFIQWIRKFS